MTARRKTAAVLITAAATTALGLAGPANAATTKHLHFFEKQTSFAANKKAGYIEFTSNDYVGTAAKHASKAVASDHFVCQLRKDKKPICDGQLAIGGSMLLIHGPGGQGDFTLPIVGGTGKFHGASGTLEVSDVTKDSSKSNLTITLKG